MNGRQAEPPAPDPGLARRLRRMRAFATALLAAMAVVYVVTTWFAARSPYVEALRAFAEAALVGGLADWFAVTALFRRPLGLPIPHTAIVPARKNQIGRALARFIRDHFLVREAVERRLEPHGSRGAPRRLARGRRQRRAREPRPGRSARVGAARRRRGGELRGALGGSLRSAFDDVPVNRAVATVLEVLTTGERADLIIDQLVDFGRSELAKNRVMIRVRIHEQSPWWLPKFVDQEIFDKLVGGLEELLEAIAADPAHPARREIKARLDVAAAGAGRGSRRSRPRAAR